MAITTSASLASAEPVVEVAVYTISKSNGGELQKMAHEGLRSMPGYKGSARMTGATDPHLYADIVVWNDVAAAQNAADLVSQSEGMKPFMNAIESMKIFRHYRLTGNLQDLLPMLKGAPYVELAAYKVKDVSKQGPLQLDLHSKLNGKSGYMKSSPLVGASESDEYLDIVGWESTAHMEAAGEAMQSNPDNAEFFRGIAAMNLFSAFKPSAVTLP